MPLEAVFRFYDQVAADNTLTNKLLELSQQADMDDTEKMQQVVDLAASRGFEFTAEEFAEVRNSPPAVYAASEGEDKDRPIPHECNNATAWQGHPPNQDPGCFLAWGCGYEHKLYSGPHIPICRGRPVGDPPPS